MLNPVKHITPIHHKQNQLEGINLAVTGAVNGDLSVRAPIFGENEEYDSLSMGINMLLAEMRTTVEKLQEERNYRNSIVSSITDCFFILNLNLSIRFINDSALSLLRYKEEELIGRDIEVLLGESSGFISEMFSELVERENQTIFESDKQGRRKHLLFSDQVEKALVSRNGRKIAVALTFSTLRNNKGQITGFMCIARDISERKLAEEKMDLKNREMKKLNDELDRFVYSTSHELRSPLASLKGLTALISQQTHEENIRHYLRMMNECIDRQDNLLKSIFDYSRNARTEVEKTKIEFRDLVKGIIESLAPLNPGNKIEYRINILDISPFHSDKERLGLILSNLISNALKYSSPAAERSYVAIDITSCGTKATIAVSDNGIGIAEEYHDKIFELFYRASCHISGAGVGLYVVKETVSRLRGTISLISGRGKGSRFIIEIPC